MDTPSGSADLAPPDLATKTMAQGEVPSGTAVGLGCFTVLDGQSCSTILDEARRTLKASREVVLSLSGCATPIAEALEALKVCFCVDEFEFFFSEYYFLWRCRTSRCVTLARGPLQAEAQTQLAVLTVLLQRTLDSSSEEVLSWLFGPPAAHPCTAPPA